MPGFQGLISQFGKLLALLPPILIGSALVVFFWGLSRFIFRVGGDEKAVEEGKNIMIWGIASIVIMMCVWGIMNFLKYNLNIPTTQL